MKTSARLRSNAHAWRSFSGAFGLTARILRAQTRSNKEAWQTYAIQKNLELAELKIAYESNRIVLQDLAIEEKKRGLGLAAPTFSPANYTTTGTAPRPAALRPGSILVAPTGRWTIAALDAKTITVTDGTNSHRYPRSTVISDLKSGRIHLEG